MNTISLRSHGYDAFGKRSVLCRVLLSSLLYHYTQRCNQGFLLCSQVFVGNVDNDGTKTNMFDPPIVAQYIRVVPLICRKACTLRMELIGCELNGNDNIMSL